VNGKNVLANPFGREYAHRPGWSPLEQLYIRTFGAVDLPTRIRAAAVLGALTGERTDRVLDFGTGTGVYALFLSRDPERSVVAMDVDPDRIRDLARIGQALGRTRLETVAGSVPALSSLPSSSLSAVLAVEVLVYLPDLDAALSEMHRLLEPGGLLVAHVPVRERMLAHEQRLLDDEKIREALARAGFTDAQLRPTFHAAATALCSAYERLSAHRVLLALAYPLLLLASRALPPFGRSGGHRLVVARKQGLSRGRAPVPQ
jgi:ubiquinone/menaquinone biosynthesis C-methylase UbiE